MHEHRGIETLDTAGEAADPGVEALLRERARIEGLRRVYDEVAERLTGELQMIAVGRGKEVFPGAETQEQMGEVKASVEHVLNINRQNVADADEMIVQLKQEIEVLANIQLLRRGVVPPR